MTDFLQHRWVKEKFQISEPNAPSRKSTQHRKPQREIKHFVKGF